MVRETNHSTSALRAGLERDDTRHQEQTMANREVGARSNRRSHIVLIPGFAGFDALGQLEYYGGITPVFGPWRSGNEVLRYFDNFTHSGRGLTSW